MHIVLLPQVGDGQRIETARRPNFGGIILPPGSWGQASSKAPLGFQACWVQCDLPTLSQLSLVPGASVIAAATPADTQETDILLQAMRQQPAPDADAKWPLRDQFVTAYREKTISWEQQQPNGLPIGMLIAMLGAELAERYLAWTGQLFSLTPIASDGMSGTSASISGRVMDAAGGGAADTWTLDAGTGSVATGVMISAATASTVTIAHDGTMAAVGVQRVSFDPTSTPAGSTLGPLARFTNSTNFYLADLNGGSVTLYSCVAGSFTAIGGPSAGWTTQNQALDCSGTSFTVLKNGVTDIGPVTDSSFASGTSGVRMFTSAAPVNLDNYLCQGATVGGATPWAHRFSRVGSGPMVS